MKLRVALLTHQEFEPPEAVNKLADEEIAPWKTEYDVYWALEDLGHQIRVLGGPSEIAEIRTMLGRWKPDVVFNLMEEFRGTDVFVPYLLGYFELVRQPFTGCNPSSLLLVDNKALTKKVLRHHRIPVPDFAVFRRGRVVRRPRRLSFPLFVKSTMHGSVGISQASVVSDDQALEERVRFVHEKLATDAICEEYVEGRELYVGVLGNRRLQTFPVWEMRFKNLAQGTLPIATEKVKWDLAYQDERGITTGPAKSLPDGIEARMLKLCRRVFRILELNGYARMDFRLTEDGRLFLLEANPNPDLAYDEDFAESAGKAGVPYPRLIQRILNLAMRYHARGPAG